MLVTWLKLFVLPLLKLLSKHACPETRFVRFGVKYVVAEYNSSTNNMIFVGGLHSGTETCGAKWRKSGKRRNGHWKCFQGPSHTSTLVVLRRQSKRKVYNIMLNKKTGDRWIPCSSPTALPLNELIIPSANPSIDTTYFQCTSSNSNNDIRRK